MWLLRLYGVILLTVFCSKEIRSDVAEDAVDNNSAMTFYQLSVDDWLDKQADFKALVVARLKTYCAFAGGTLCSMQNSSEVSLFTDANVVLSSGYPEKQGRQTEIQIYITYPSGMSLNAGTLTVLEDKHVDAMTDGLKDEFEALYETIIIEMNGFFHGKAASTTANKIIIPIAFAVVIGVCIMAVVLHFYGKNRDKKRRERKPVKETSKVSPGYKKVDEQQVYKNNLKQTNGSTSQNIFTFDLDHHQEDLNKVCSSPGQSKDGWYADKQTGQQSAAQNDLGRDPQVRNPDNMDSDEYNQWEEERRREKKERKKKKKKKKHAKRDLEGEDNCAYTSGTDNLVQAEHVPPRADYMPPNVETTEL